MTMLQADFSQLVDLDVDGSLEAADRDRLAASASNAEELAAERRRLERLHTMLADVRVPVRPGFEDEVLASLPPAEWQLGWRGFRPAVALLAVLVGLAALVTLFGASTELGSPALGALGAVGDFVVAAVLSGAGLLAASWRGVGYAVGEALGVPEQVVFGVGVVALNALLFMLVRGARRRRAAQSVEAERR